MIHLKIAAGGSKGCWVQHQNVHLTEIPPLSSNTLPRLEVDPDGLVFFLGKILALHLMSLPVGWARKITRHGLQKKKLSVHATEKSRMIFRAMHKRRRFTSFKLHSLPCPASLPRQMGLEVLIGIMMGQDGTQNFCSLQTDLRPITCFS